MATADDPTEALPPNPYRAGYREGFHDGFSQGVKSGDEKKEDAKKGDEKGGDDKKDDAEKKGDDKKDGDSDKDGEGDKKDGDKKEGDKDDKKGDDGKPPLYKRPLVVGLVLALVLVLLIAGILFWRHSRTHESTDDAFVDGQTSQIAAQTSGRVTRLYVTDNQVVKAGEPLLDIDARDSDARIAEARAQLVNAESQVDQATAQVAVRRAAAAEADATARQSQAELDKAAQDLARYRLVDPDAVAGQQVDAAESQARSARAQLDASRMNARSAHAQVEAAMAQVRTAQAGIESARANVTSADVQSSYTHVVAPFAGRVTRRTVDVGNVVANGQALLAVVSESLWVTANYKETQLTRMQPGQPVEIQVDAFPDLKLHGHVDSIAKGTGSYFSTLPAENATGNYVKVVQRVPVKIVFDDDRIRNYPIGPGMSVTPNVELQ